MAKGLPDVFLRCHINLYGRLLKITSSKFSGRSKQTITRRMINRVFELYQSVRLSAHFPFATFAFPFYEGSDALCASTLSNQRGIYEAEPRYFLWFMERMTTYCGILFVSF